VSPDLGPGPRTRVRRLPAKAAYDEATVYAILDAAPFAHVAAVVDGEAVALPTLVARDGRALYLHGSPGNAVLRAVVASGRAFVTATLYDGLRLARSGFESSIAYRSAVVVGRARALPEGPERDAALTRLVDAVLPGRSAEVRAMTESEARLTLVVRVEVDEASAKVSAGPTDDAAEDLGLGLWAGDVPARLAWGAPAAYPGVDAAVPASVRALLDAPRAEALRAELAVHAPADDREAASLAATLARLSGPAPFDESSDAHHVTASAFVVSSRGFLLHRHKRTGRWLQPGGHVDPGEAPAAAAAREALEETGLWPRVGEPLRLRHVDVHPGPRGHTHYDVRYLLVSDPLDPRPAPGESPEAAWFSPAEAARLVPDLAGVITRLAAEAPWESGS
jgi:uncharacterized protein